MGQDLEGSREVRSREATERGQVRMTFLCARPHLRAMGSPGRRRQVCLHSAEHGRWERRLVPARLACHGPWMPTTEGTAATCHVSARPVCRKDPTAAAAPPWASSTGCWALGGLSMSWLSQVLTSKALAEASLLHVAQEGLCRQSPQPLGSWPRFCLLAESQPAADVHVLFGRPAGSGPLQADPGLLVSSMHPKHQACCVLSECRPPAGCCAQCWGVLEINP